MVGPDGKGVPGIEVIASSPLGKLDAYGSAISGEQGEFRIDSLAQGEYSLLAGALGYDAPVERVATGTRDLMVVLPEHGQVTGVALAPDGLGIEDLAVQARKRNSPEPFVVIESGQRIEGPSDGAFRLAGLSRGSFVIEATARGFATSTSEPFEVAPGSTTEGVVVCLTAGGSIAGVLVDARTGAPVAGAEVTLADDGFGHVGPSFLSRASTLTNTTGRFFLEQVAAGTRSLLARSGDHASLVVAGVQVEEGRATELPPRAMLPGATVRGIVDGPGGRTVTAATVQLTPVDSNQLYGHRTTRTDARGGFRIEHVQPGTYQLSAVRSHSGAGNPFEAIADMRHSQVEVVLRDGEEYERDLHFGEKRPEKR